MLAKAGVSDLTRRFVGVVTYNRRLFVLPQIIRRLPGAARGTTRRGDGRSDVGQHARPAPCRGARPSRSAAIVGGKVTVDLKVDPSILGGLVVRVGSRMFDSSLRTKLQSLQLAMKGIG